MKQGDRETGGRYPLDNLTFDVITILYEKSKALEAFDQYVQDAEGNQEIKQIFERIRREDEECVIELRKRLSTLLEKSGSQPRPSRTASTGTGSAKTGSIT